MRLSNPKFIIAGLALSSIFSIAQGSTNSDLRLDRDSLLETLGYSTLELESGEKTKRLKSIIEGNRNEMKEISIIASFDFSNYEQASTKFDPSGYREGDIPLAKAEHEFIGDSIKSFDKSALGIRNENTSLTKFVFEYFKSLKNSNIYMEGIVDEYVSSNKENLNKQCSKIQSSLSNFESIKISGSTFRFKANIESNMKDYLSISQCFEDIHKVFDEMYFEINPDGYKFDFTTLYEGANKEIAGISRISDSGDIEWVENIYKKAK